MKHLSTFLFCIIAMMVTACGSDDPKITFHDYNGTYNIGDKQLIVNLNGVILTDTKTSVEISFDEGHIATLTLVQVFPGNNHVVIGGVEVTENPDGPGIIFSGQVAISDTELAIFSGSVINLHLTLNVTTIPIPQAPIPES